MIVSKKAILGLIDSLDDDIGIQVSNNILIKKESSTYGGLATVPIDKKDLKNFIDNMGDEKFSMHYCGELTIKSIESDRLDEIEKKINGANFMMDRLGIIHYVVVDENKILSSEIIFKRSWISNDLLKRLKANRKKWITR